MINTNTKKYSFGPCLIYSCAVGSVHELNYARTGEVLRGGAPLPTCYCQQWLSEAERTEPGTVHQDTDLESEGWMRDE